MRVLCSVPVFRFSCIILRVPWGARCSTGDDRLVLQLRARVPGRSAGHDSAAGRKAQAVSDDQGRQGQGQGVKRFDKVPIACSRCSFPSPAHPSLLRVGGRGKGKAFWSLGGRVAETAEVTVKILSWSCVRLAVRKDMTAETAESR